MRINLGSGDTRYDSFLNIDNDPDCNPDFCIDIENQAWPIEDNSVEQVIAHHIFEHLGEGFFHVMKELYRVCKNGAQIDVIVPHPRHETFLADPTHRRPIVPMTFQLFSKKFNDACRLYNEPASRLGHRYNVDFELVEFHEIPDDRYLRTFDNVELETAKVYINEHNNIVLNIHIKLVVIKHD